MKKPERKRILLKRGCQIDRVSYEAGQVVEADARTIDTLIAIGRGVAAPMDAPEPEKKPDRKRKSPNDRMLRDFDER